METIYKLFTHNLKNSLKLIQLTIAITVLSACSGNINFSNQFASGVDVKSLDNGNFTVTETFDLEKSSTRKLDIVWVIDNSGSMAREAAHVRANYLKFIDGLKQNADTKSALISLEGDVETRVRMPASIRGSNHKQINVSVGSRDGMCLGEMSLRSSNELAGGGFSVCSAPRNYQTLSLDGFLRPTSQKIYIFVTDDNETNITNQNFLDTFSQKYKQRPVVYGFIGKGAASPCQARTGFSYEELATSTNGKTFNICDTNWDTHFSELTNHVIESVKSSFSLTYSHLVEKAQVVVRLGNTILSPSQYTIANGLIRIDENLLIGSQEKVSVDYTVSQLRD